jgi:hypothetical protein
MRRKAAITHQKDMVSRRPSSRGAVKGREATAKRLALDGEHGDGIRAIARLFEPCRQPQGVDGRDKPGQDGVGDDVAGFVRQRSQAVLVLAPAYITLRSMIGRPAAMRSKAKSARSSVA